MAVDKELLEILACPIYRFLACPACKEGLEEKDGGFNCKVCGKSYPVKDGIPDMVDPALDPEQKNGVEAESSFFDKYGGGKQEYHVYHKSEYGRVLDLMGLLGRKETVLSIGCDSGVFEGELKRRGYEVYGIDLSMVLLSHCSFPVARADGTRLPFSSASFGHVFCAGILHHIPTSLHEEAVTEAARVILPEGWFHAFEPKTTFRSRFLHPVPQFMNMRTKGEEPIELEAFLEKVSARFEETGSRLVREVKFIDLSPATLLIYKIVKTAFDLIPGTDKDEFFIIMGRKGA